jgi:hypothetical protein
MLAGSLSYSVHENGVDGFANWSAGFGGGVAGYASADYAYQHFGSAGGAGSEAASYENNMPDDLARQRQEIADYNADYYGYTRGKYNSNLDASGRTTYDGATVDVNGKVVYHGHIEYGPGAFEYVSWQQAVGANESWKLNALYQGQWHIAGNRLLNRSELEMAAAAWTINNASRLNMTPLAARLMVQQYNYFGKFINAPPWGE